MSDKVFLDTNLWFYFFVKTPQAKFERVQELVDAEAESVYVSTQVLGELFNALTRKSSFSRGEVGNIIFDLISSLPILEIDTSKVLQALEVNSRYGYTYWDSLIIATALSSDCTILYSEDMQHNQLIENKLRIVNPFTNPVA